MVTALWIVVALLVAILVPDVSQVISAIGGISAFFIFIFPGEERFRRRDSAPLRRRLHSKAPLRLNRTLLDVCPAVGTGVPEDEVRSAIIDSFNGLSVRADKRA